LQGQEKYTKKFKKREKPACPYNFGQYCILMSRKYEKLRKKILILHELHQNWSSTDIANELMNSYCPPSQTRYTLIRYVNYTIKRGTIEARKRTGRPRTTRTSRFISLVKYHMENRSGQSIRKTNDLFKKNM